MACFAEKKNVLPPFLQLSDGGECETNMLPHYTSLQLQQAKNTDSVNKQLNIFTKKNPKITHITNDLFNNENRHRPFQKMIK